MSRLIDADVLKQDINKVSTHWLNEWSTLGVLAMVDKHPTVDAVPVVRCLECKHSSKGILGMIHCKFDMRVRRADWFCADGERKGGDE